MSGLPQSLNIWPLEMRSSGRGLEPSNRVTEKGFQALGESAINAKIFFFDTMHFQIYIREKGGSERCYLLTE